MDNSGFSKGYGFVRFGSEDEQKDSLTSMNGYLGLGTKALKICNAVPKPKGSMSGPVGNNISTTYTPPSTDYSQYYDPSYWQNYWQASYGYEHQQDPNAAAAHEAYIAPDASIMGHAEKKEDDELQLIGKISSFAKYSGVCRLLPEVVHQSKTGLNIFSVYQYKNHLNYLS